MAPCSCGCGKAQKTPSEEEEEGLPAWKLGIAVVLFVVGMLWRHLGSDATGSTLLFLFVYGYVGLGVVRHAVANLFRGHIFDENFLMTVATLGAFALGDWAEGAAVMLFWQIGETFQAHAVASSKKRIAGLLAIRPDSVRVLRGGEAQEVCPRTVEAGETFLVFPGERIPLDGTVLEGESTLDCAALTGESLPRHVEPGEGVLSGAINLSGRLTLRADRPFHESTLSKILAMMEEAGARKAKTEAFITRFARVYTPIVTLGALALAVVPPLVGMGTFGVWVYRALNFLVISCPCALVISVPLTFFAGMGAASRRGILIKGGKTLDQLAEIRSVVFDKTGTLTQGSFAITEIRPALMEKEALLDLAAHAESISNHPLARAVLRAFGKAVSSERITEAEELAGYGVRVKVDGKRVLVGNLRLLEREGIQVPEGLPESGTVLHVALEARYAGTLLAEDSLKAGTAEAVDALRALGVDELVLLSGDQEEAARRVADKLHFDAVHARLLPTDKVERVEALLHALHQRAPGATLAFVGDGINDAPVLARADVGIAMGGIGSDAAIEAADAVIMTDEPGKVAEAIRVARRTLFLARENIAFAISVKVVVLGLSVFGFTTLWLAVFADVGVALLAVLNALRAMK